LLFVFVGAAVVIVIAPALLAMAFGRDAITA
jgi:hypothetical protein